MQPSTYSSTHQATHTSEASSSGVSWGAVICGAVVAAALALVLLALGAGLGLSSVSPWSNGGASPKTIGIATIVWLALMQIVASGMGGYLAGRLRTKWVDLHTDEVFFRDTAHGFLVWAVGVVITASLLASAASSMVSGTAQLGATVVSSAAGGAAAATSQATGPSANPSDYFTDLLLRSERPSTEATNTSVRAEVGRIIAAGLARGELAPADRAYLGTLVSSRTGLAPPEAEKRVNDALAQMKAAETATREAADTARKAAAQLSFWTFVSLLIGAFCASYAATIGGKQRDHISA
jgi:uncharacterized RDD family membrane protein YckC